jgi:hypothetical protein
MRANLYGFCLFELVSGYEGVLVLSRASEEVGEAIVGAFQALLDVFPLVLPRIYLFDELAAFSFEFV